MKKVLFLTPLVALLIFDCTPTGGLKKNSQQNVESSDFDSGTEKRYVPSTPARYTFLDTLNRGREIDLSEPEPAPQESPALQSGMVSASSTESPLSYKIQLFASSQIETVREQKREMEARINLPFTINFEAPYYKLWAGNFAQRSEAEIQLKKIQKLGYADAWIVSAKSANN